jgi:hypothetical protein
MALDKARRLLERGYFPSQLPPAFSTREFAKHYKALVSAWKALGKKVPSSRAESFSVARAGHNRRRTALVNPIAQSLLCVDIATYWKAIARHYKQSSLSISQPKFVMNAERAASIPSMHDLYERKVSASAGYKYMLRTDISRFFPTIYTHTLPWALHGKSNAKRNQGEFTAKFYGNILDSAVRRGQEKQTIGLPIGPDTSHVLAEIIATSIDIEIERSLKEWPPGFRYVDDYYLFFQSQDSAEKALATIGGALQMFELQMNVDKTFISTIDRISEDFWTHELRDFEIAGEGQLQRSSLHHFFDLANDLARKQSDENVMKYALKKVSSIVVTKENWPLFQAHIARVALAYPNTLQTIAHILFTYAHYRYPLDVAMLLRLCDKLFDEHAPLGHDSEVAWCLWMCKSLKLKVGKDAVNAIAKMQSAVCALLLLDLESARMTKRRVPKGDWRQLMVRPALWEERWLLAYEAGVRKWVTKSDAHITADPYFRELKDRGVRFYDESAVFPLLFKVKDAAVAQLEVGDEFAVFDLNADLSKFVEFEEFDITYGGVSSVDDFEVIEPPLE